jgi:hypothetical protein
MDRNDRRFAWLVVSAASSGFAFLTACGSSAAAPDAGATGAPGPDGGATTVADAIRNSCDLAEAAACPKPPRYADIAPIVERSCVPCHSSDASDGEWPLTEYSDVAPWAALVQDDLCTYRMPPLDGGVDITAADRLAVLDWIQCGALE